jgi:mono/diheme cytochrome c family protein
MRSLSWFLGGAVAMALFVCAAGFLYIRTSVHGFGTRAQPSALETFAARFVREMAMPAGAREKRNPIASSNASIAEGRAHWADHCAICHANNGSGQTEMGRNLYPPVPDMRAADTQRKTDGELFYIIENGIRLSGMPAWGNGTPQDEEHSWKLVIFIRHLPSLTPQEEQEMKKLNPISPQELKEELKEEKFLNGDQSHDPTH